MHTLNLRLSGEEIAWIAGHAKDRFLIVDDILLPLCRQVAGAISFRESYRVSLRRRAVSGRCANYERLIAPYMGRSFTPAPHDENDPIAMCYTSGTTGRPKGVAYSHRSTCCIRWAFAFRSIGRSGSDVAGGDAHVPCQLLGDSARGHDAWLQAGDARQAAPCRRPSGSHRANAPTLSLGVPTIWLCIILAMERKAGAGAYPRGCAALSAAPRYRRALMRAFAQRRGVDPGWG